MVSARSLTTTADVFCQRRHCGGLGEPSRSCSFTCTHVIVAEDGLVLNGVNGESGEVASLGLGEVLADGDGSTVEGSVNETRRGEVADETTKIGVCDACQFTRRSLGKKRSGGPPDSRGTRNKRCGRRGEGGARCLGHVGGGGLLTPRGSAKRVNGTRGHV